MSRPAASDRGPPFEFAVRLRNGAIPEISTGDFMADQLPRAQRHAADWRGAPAGGEPDQGATHGATAVRPATTHDRQARRKNLAGGLIGALSVTVISAVFVVCFVGGLHAPGPRSVPVGLVGSQAQASRAGAALGHLVPGAFTITGYATEAAARTAISGRSIDGALVPGPAVQHLLVATAVSQAETNAIVKTFSAASAKAHVPLVVTDIRPLHPGDPQGLSQVFFVVALLAPSVGLGNLLINRIGPRLTEFWHLAMIAVYAVIIAAVATAIADGLIGALTGAPWAIFGIGVLLAFAAAVMSAAATRWVGGIGYVVILLLFVPVGISSSGTTLGPHMITPWYADLGKALPPGTAQPAVRNVTYFNGTAILDPLLILSAWALAGVIALVLAAILHPPTPRQPGQIPGAAVGSTPAEAGRQGAGVPG